MFSHVQGMLMPQANSGGQCFVGMTQHDFGTFDRPSHTLTNFSDRSVASDVNSFPTIIQQQNYTLHQMKVSPTGSMTNRESGVNLETGMPMLKCPECGIKKRSNGDLEVHIKTEHLGWLPFQCPICTALRASDLQMREHIHSHHKKNETKYIYVDNPQAKELLQGMVDKALSNIFQCIQQQIMTYYDDSGINARGGAPQQKRTRLDDSNTGAPQQERRRLDDSNTGEDHRPNSFFGSIKAHDKVTPSRQTPNSSNAINEAKQRNFGQNDDGIKSNSVFDCSVDCSSDDAVPDEEEEEDDEYDDDDFLPNDNNHQMNRTLQQKQQQKKANTFFTSRDNLIHPIDDTDVQKRQQDFYRRIVPNRSGPVTSKKRVLGLCTECKKPITAGARQMHMFYHLGKANAYRFRCLFPGCKVQHYRKDQMENHQSKAHGKINAEMMEDKSTELYNMVQEMSMKLLGTAGNTPGPTAGEAQRIYERQVREMEANLGMRKRRKPRPVDCTLPTDNRSGTAIYDSANRRVEELECRRCKKFILNRIKGFHILWHLNTDLGIVRYGCKHCNFKHDRPQSVAAHGLREHSDQSACMDLLYNYERQLLAMSKECFGVERLFEKEIRRRNRLERFARCSQPAAGNSFDKRICTDDSSHYNNKDESKHPHQFPMKDNMDREWTHDEDNESKKDENEHPLENEEEMSEKYEEEEEHGFYL